MFRCLHCGCMFDYREHTNHTDEPYKLDLNLCSDACQSAHELTKRLDAHFDRQTQAVTGGEFAPITLDGGLEQLRQVKRDFDALTTRLDIEAAERIFPDPCNFDEQRKFLDRELAKSLGLPLSAFAPIEVGAHVERERKEQLQANQCPQCYGPIVKRSFLSSTDLVFCSPACAQAYKAELKPSGL